MTDAPERIYLDGDVEAGDGMFPRCFEDAKYASEPPVEYIRADLSQAAVEALEAKLAKAVGALDDLISTYVWVREDEYERGWSEMSNAVHEATFVQMELKGEENE